MQDGEMTIFGAGRYVDRVKRDAGSWKFASKIVVLDSRQIDTLLAIPVCDGQRDRWQAVASLHQAAGDGARAYGLPAHYIHFLESVDHANR
jgi:hypothetical protein